MLRLLRIAVRRRRQRIVSGLTSWNGRIVSFAGERYFEIGSVFLRRGARPPIDEVIVFVDANKDMCTDGLRWGIEPILAVLEVAPSTYWSAKRRPPCQRSISDAALRIEVRRVFEANYAVYGANKIWVQLRREGHVVGRDRVARIMRQLAIAGVSRGVKTPFTTIPGDVDGRPDRVKRNFTAPAPNRLWVADLTYVRTFTGWVYVAFIVDVFSRRIVGWQAPVSLRSDLALDALDRCSPGCLRRTRSAPRSRP